MRWIGKSAALLEAALTKLGKGVSCMRRRHIISGLLLALVAPLAVEAPPAGRVRA